MNSSRDLRELPDEPPPFLRTWGRVYAAVLMYLVIVIALFALFTAYYA